MAGTSPAMTKKARILCLFACPHRLDSPLPRRYGPALQTPHARPILPMDALPDHMRPERSFQGLILALQRFWAEQGCVILQPYDMEMGAGTFHPATTLRALGPK